MGAIGFDNQKYLTTQSEQIKKRIHQFGGKLYLEFGGKLFDDYHASRVLPGFEPDSKIRMLQQLKDDVEIVIMTVPNRPLSRVPRHCWKPSPAMRIHRWKIAFFFPRCRPAPERGPHWG